MTDWTLGCTGNRQYTDLADDELYVAIAGADLPRAVAELDGIVAANATLAEYHAGRRRTVSGGHLMGRGEPGSRARPAAS